MKRFWNWKTVQNDEQTERVLTIDGTIAEESWWDDDVTPAQFRAELHAGRGPVTLYINSPGGDCFAASQIYTMLSEYEDQVTVKIDGIAASAASVIAMAGTKVLMAPTAMMMIHNPATLAFGDSNEMAHAIELLDEVKESIINAYEIKTGMQRAKIARLMDVETWMNAKKAIELGFADGMIEGSNNTPADVGAFAFEAKTTENQLMARAVAKAKAHEPKPTGRRVETLLEELNKKNH